MAAKRQYANPEMYEKKLKRVMERLGVQRFSYDYGRYGCFVEFVRKGKARRFEYTVQIAQVRGKKLHYGSDCFALLVLTLEALARAAENGVYDMDELLDGLPALQAPRPDWCNVLGLREIPSSLAEVHARYRTMAMAAHPDQGGTDEEFIRLKVAYEQAIAYFEGGGD